MREERRLAFGSVADLYDRVRPTYPSELIDDVIAYSGVGGSDRALEVGAGTGKATVLFAERDVTIHALEPSESMAAVARRICRPYDRVAIEQTDFEHFSTPDGAFRLVFSAQAWHWVTPEIRYVKARAALADGGALALFANRPNWDRSPHREMLREAYRGAAPAFAALGGAGPMHPGTEGTSPLWGDWEGELQSALGFERPEPRAYEWSITYSAGDYLELLRTHSDHMLLPEPERSALFAAVGAAIGQGGGELRVDYVTKLCLARARAGG